MQTNAVPAYDRSDNPTGCCPKFNPKGWDGQELHFENKRFVKAKTRSAMHIPLNMGSTFERVNKHIEAAGAFDPDDYIVLSRDPSAFAGEHLFAVSKPVEGEEMTTLSGDFITKVFEGSYREMKTWHAEMQALAATRGVADATVHFFYTTCPKCAKAYGENYVVGVAQV